VGDDYQDQLSATHNLTLRHVRPFENQPIDSPNHMTAVRRTGGFGGSAWIRR
jgi:hypothetical protein